MTQITKEAISRAIRDPGVTEGYKGDRTRSEWQTDAVMRVLSTLPIAVEGKVKALEWRLNEEGWQIADTFFGGYRVERNPHDRWCWGVYFHGEKGVGLNPEDNFEAAKDAAQDDFNERINSARSVEAGPNFRDMIIIGDTAYPVHSEVCRAFNELSAALSVPAEAVVGEPVGDWTVDDTETAGEILTMLGIGCDASKEPGADWRRDKIAKLIRTRISQQDAELERLRREVEEARKDIETAHAMGRQLIAEARRATFTEAAVFAKNWLEDWGSELQGTCDAYREAVSLGKFSGRKIAPDQAKTYARQFSERSDAVYACGELLAKDLRAKAEETGR